MSYFHRRIRKFNQNHDPHSGEFSEGYGGESGQIKTLAEITDYKSMSPSEVMSLKRYTGSKADYINRGLRSGGLPNKNVDDAAININIHDLDATIDRSSLPRDTVVYRGMAHYLEHFGITNFAPGANTDESLIGKTFTDKGYTSTSLDQATALNFGQKDTDGQYTVMEIHAPKGMHALGVPYAFMDEAALDEKEVILPRGLTYKITQVKHEPLLKNQPVRVLVLTPVIQKNDFKTVLDAAHSRKAPTTPNRFVWEPGDLEMHE